MRTLPSLRRIAMSPWAYEASKPELIAILDARAEMLGAMVSTIKRRDHRWMARAFSERGGQIQDAVSFVGTTLEGAIEGALDAYSDTYEPYADDDRPDDDDPGPSRLEREGLPEFNGAFTAEELVQIQKQSV